jgi:hypothetical protein
MSGATIVRCDLAFVGGFVLATACLGCGKRTGATERFVPPAATAREALSTALKSWQNGDAPGTIPATSPPIQLVDAHRKPGQKLASCAILGEVAGGGPRTFAVKVKFEDPPEESRLRFVVVGRDPIWIFREEDYELLLHWEHAMPGPANDGEAESTASPATD